MKKFMDKDFLLTTETAKTLYHDYAAKMPIIDYHCHINPKEIATNHRFRNITEAWLGGDHYKWRMIRSNGVDEKYITGDASDKEKFLAFAASLPRAIGNPIYHWTHLELKTYFGYEGVLNADTAEEVWELCNKKLEEDNMGVQGIIAQSNVTAIGTTDDPIDTLEWHKVIREEKSCDAAVIPSFRPDKAVNVEKEDFADYISKLSAVSGMAITNVDTLLDALATRIKHFDDNGCCASDHGLDYVVYRTASDSEVEEIFQKGLANEALTLEEVEKYKTKLMVFFGRQYAKYNWVMQLHYGAIRNTNQDMFRKLGPDTGFDCIANTSCALNIVGFLNALQETKELPKTILYSLNPSDNEVLGTILGCFQGTEVAGKIQHGSAWWFNDTKTGMFKQLTDLANLSVLGNFVGMLTDSRSFLSYTRHEYFRRILCELIGGWVENGEYPNDTAFLGSLVQDICYNNANRYFGLNR